MDNRRTKACCSFSRERYKKIYDYNKKGHLHKDANARKSGEESKLYVFQHFLRLLMITMNVWNVEFVVIVLHPLFCQM